jgi:chaperonin GroEL (HSP60 family)
LLRGPSEHMLDEVERSLHDALCVIKVHIANTVFAMYGQ